MVDTARATDKGIGLAVLGAILAIFGAAVMYVGAPDDTLTSASGFAAAMVFGTLAVIAIHAHGS